jgi:regulator of vacuolar morphogenesis
MAPLKLSVPSAHTITPESGKPYTEYTIKIEPPFPRPSSTVSKRYSHFAALDAALRSAVGSAPPTALPAKSWGFLGFGNTVASPDAIDKRRLGLEAYLRAIESTDDARWRAAAPYRTFLGLDDDAASKKSAAFAGSQFGKDRVRDSSDWLDKHQQVRSALQDARRCLTAREQAMAATAQHEAAANAKKSLVRASTLLSSLDEGLRRLSGASSDEWSGEKLGDGEVRRRRDMISAARKERDGLESVLNTMAVKAALGGTSSASTPSTSSAAVTAEQKAGLFKGASKPSSRRVLGGPAPETERTRELDNQGVLQLQQQIMAEQDEDLVDLTKVVARMRQMGVAINEEIVVQNAMLGLLEEDVERVDGKIRIAKKRVDKIS